jgi:predicted nucleic acid-binding protein
MEMYLGTLISRSAHMMMRSAVAMELGLNISGTLGILLAAHKRGLLSDLQGALNELQASGFRISETLIASILKIIGTFF